MGCWNETCEITNVPIMADERCIMIDFRGPKPGRSAHEQLKRIGREVTRIVKGTYSDYGDLNEFPDEIYPGIETPRKGEEYLMRPKYIRDDGMIPVTLRSFIKETVWDKIQKETNEPKIHSGIKGETKPLSEYINEYQIAKAEADKIKVQTVKSIILKYKTSEMKHTLEYFCNPDLDYGVEFAKFIDFMTTCRLSFTGINYAGCQHTEENLHIIRAEMILEEASKLKEEDE